MAEYKSKPKIVHQLITKADLKASAYKAVPMSFKAPIPPQRRGIGVMVIGNSFIVD